MADAESQRKAVQGFFQAYMKRVKNAKDFGSIEKAQQLSRRPRPVKGPIRVSRVRISNPSEDDARAFVWKVTRHLARDDQIIHEPCYPEHGHLVGEWTAYRHKDADAAALDGKEPIGQEEGLGENERFRIMSSDNQPGQDAVVLYFQGGGFITGGVSTARSVVSKLAEQSRMRFFTIDYRLSPQHTLPTQHVDAFLAYLYLLSPPPGSFHKPIPASKIVFAGESAGAALALALIQIILRLQRLGHRSIHAWGADIPLQLPAGLAGVSMPGDYLQSLPSLHAGNENDWLRDLSPYNDPEFPPERIWPSNPPRWTIFCDSSAADHPLFSAATAHDWTGAPPIWTALGGGEAIADGTKLVVQKAVGQGVRVQFEEYEYMTHVYFTTVPRLPQSKQTIAHMAAALRVFAYKPESFQTSAVHYALGDLQSSPLNINRLTTVEWEDALKMIARRRASKVGLKWTGKADYPKL